MAVFGLVLLLPAVAIGTAAVWHALRTYEAAFELRLRDTARSLAAAIDGELNTLLTLARSIGASPLLSLPDSELHRAESWLREVAQTVGVSVIVNDAAPGHQQLINTRLPLGAALPPPSNPGEGAWDLIRRVADTGQPAVSDLFIARPTERLLVSVAAPVTGEDGRVTRVVALGIDPARLAAILRTPDLKGGAYAGIADGKGRIVTRSRDHERVVGAAAPGRATRLGAQVPGTDVTLLRAPTPDAGPSLIAVSELRTAPGWSLAVAEPLSAYQASFRRPFIEFGAGAAALLILSLGAAALLAGRLRRGLEEVLHNAHDLVPPPGQASAGAARVREFEDLGEITRSAGETLREQERLLRLAQQAAGAASWSWIPGSGEVRWSSEMFALLGVDPSCEVATFDGYMRHVHPADRDGLAGAMQAALRAGGMTWEFRVLRPRLGGSVEKRWILSRARLYPAEGSRPATLIGIDIDVTERRRAEERFEIATAAMEGFVYEWDVVAGTVQRTVGVVQVAGEPIETGAEAWIERIHPEDKAQAMAECRAAMEDPARDRYAFEYRIRRADGGWAWIWDRGRITRDPSTGSPLRVVGGSVDITARKLAEERQLLLLRELDHRGKNSLAVVKAALRLAPRRDPEVFEMLEGRVDALARAQTMLSETGWSGTDLLELLAASLAPFDGGTGETRIRLEGESLRLASTATQPIAMVVHELATNAVKYGALSRPEGRLRLAWAVAGSELKITWEETGGPLISEPPTRRGFGSRVVDMTVRNQLGGRVGWSWRAEGLSVEMSIPRKRVLAESQAALRPV